MKSTLILLFLFAICLVGKGQSTNDVLVHAGFDLVKTDNNKLFEKGQFGFEADYFVVRHFAVGIGAEVWTAQRTSFAMGARWYANDNIFFRFRGLIGVNDAVAGIGWSKPIGNFLRFEALGDFYLGDLDFGLRGGLSYVIR